MVRMATLTVDWKPDDLPEERKVEWRQAIAGAILGSPYTSAVFAFTRQGGYWSLVFTMGKSGSEIRDDEGEGPTLGRSDHTEVPELALRVVAALAAIGEVVRVSTK